MNMTEPVYSGAWRVFSNVGMDAIMHLTMKLDLQGLENVPKTGPLLIIINHSSFLDPLVPCVHVRDDIFPMAKAEALEHRLGWALKWYGAFPVRRGAGDVHALKMALKVLKAGHTLLMAPEGTRNVEGVLRDGHEGAALIALRSGAPILPIAMRGGVPYFVNLKRFRRTPISMRVGAPVMVRPLDHKATREDLRGITAEMMYALAALLPPELRGNYADVDQFVPRYLTAYTTTPSVSAATNREVMPLTN